MSAYHLIAFLGPIAPDLSGTIIYGLALAAVLTIAIMLKVLK